MKNLHDTNPFNKSDEINFSKRDNSRKKRTTLYLVLCTVLRGLFDSSSQLLQEVTGAALWSMRSELNGLPLLSFLKECGHAVCVSLHFGVRVPLILWQEIKE